MKNELKRIEILLQDCSDNVCEREENLVGTRKKEALRTNWNLFRSWWKFSQFGNWDWVIYMYHSSLVTLTLRSKLLPISKAELISPIFFYSHSCKHQRYVCYRNIWIALMMFKSQVRLLHCIARTTTVSLGITSRNPLVIPYQQHSICTRSTSACSRTQKVFQNNPT